MSKTNHKAFTLIELLVVISIIALLIAVLLPVLQAAREAARDVACLSNNRQIALGIHAYTNDSLGTLPIGRWTGWPSPQPSDEATWYTLINPYVGGVGDTYKTIGLTNPAATGFLNRLFQCPNAAIDAGGSHYSSNPIVMIRIFESGDFPIQNLDTMVDASEVVLVADGSQVQGHFNWSAEPTAFMVNNGVTFNAPFWTIGLTAAQRSVVIEKGANYDPNAFLYPPGADFRWRHGQENVVNALYADGHAAAEPEGALLRGNLFPQGWKPK